MGLTEMMSGCQQGQVPSGGARREPVSLPFQLLEATYVFRLHLQASNMGLSLPHAAISLVLSFLSSSATCKDPWNGIGPIWAVQDDFPVSCLIDYQP